MKKTPNTRIYKQFLYILPLFTLIGSAYGMKRLHEEPSKSTSSMEIEKPARVEKLKNIWIRTSDDQVIAMPEWQVDQVKVLQLLLLQQKGTNSKRNPINLLDLRKNNGKIVNTSKNTLNLIKTAMKVSGDPEKLSIFLISTQQNNQADYETLINTSFDLEANALSAALASEILPKDVQSKKIQSRILSPVIEHFVESLAIECMSLEAPINAVYTAHTPYIKISPNGQYLLSYNRYDSTKSWLWDLSTQKIIGTLQNRLDNVNFSSTSKYVTSYIINGYFVYDYITKIQAFILNNSNCLAFSPDDTYCLFNSTNTPGIINIKSHRDTQNWVGLPALQGHTAHVNTIQFSPDGNYIVSGSNDDYPNNLILWDGNSLQKITNLTYEGPWTAHIYPVIQAHFTPDNKYIISTDDQGYTIIWDVASKKPIVKLDTKSQNLWYADNKKPATLNFPVPKFMYILHNLHTYINPDNPDAKVLYEFMVNQIFNHAILPINKDAISILETKSQYKDIIRKQYSSIPPFEFKKQEEPIFNKGHDLQYAVESSDSQYLLLSYHPGYITLVPHGSDKLLFIPVQPYKTVRFSPTNDYIIITHHPENDCMFTLWNMTDLIMIRHVSYIPLTLSQSRFLYRLYLALINGVKVVIDQNDSDYEAYKSLPEGMKNLVDKFLPFETTQNA